MRVVSIENRRRVTFEGPAAPNTSADADTDFQPPEMVRLAWLHCNELPNVVCLAGSALVSRWAVI